MFYLLLLFFLVADAAEIYQSQTKTIQLYQIIDDEHVYLDLSNNEINQYIVKSDRLHKFLNLIQYSLEKKSEEWDDDNQIVLRHELSSEYFCITNCGKFYMSPKLITDCVFIRELVQDLTTELEKIYLKKKIFNTVYTVNFDYGQISLTEDDSTIYSVEVPSVKKQQPKLTPLVDEADDEICNKKIKKKEKIEVEEEKEEEEQKEEYKTTVLIREANLFNSNNILTIIIVCSTLSIVTLGIVLIVYIIKKLKN